MIEDAYEILKISRDAAPEEVRAAYVKLVRRYPPEHFPERLAAFRNAYDKVCLDDSFLISLLSADICRKTPIEFAGFLWGDRKEFKAQESDLLDLAALIDGENARKADDILESVDTSNIEWRGKN
jgi:curved DNA-binding protein CbpA